MVLVFFPLPAAERFEFQVIVIRNFASFICMPSLNTYWPSLKPFPTSSAETTGGLPIIRIDTCPAGYQTTGQTP